MPEIKAAVQKLETQLKCSWPSIRDAAKLTAEKRHAITHLLAGLDSEDISIVVFGSLAREEFTPGSDLDWTLLVDGQADPQHLRVAQAVAARLIDAEFKEPGREGLFGRMAFSHSVVHQIGGEDDTNRNITQRILLLLESTPLGRRDAYDRVVRNILDRYITEDDGLWHGRRPHKVPRFLLNDIVRYWRTIAVDFAYKQRERAGAEFALRSAKLRMSRKLIFVAGLLTCFGCHLYLPSDTRAAIFGPKPNPAPLIDHLQSFVEATPLDILAYELLQQPAPEAVATTLFGAYDRFLALLADTTRRDHLKALTPDKLANDSVFGEVRQMGHDFEAGLADVFFGEQSRLTDLTRQYGVF
jgi:predicted nucleotidyltransferase